MPVLSQDLNLPFSFIDDIHDVVPAFELKRELLNSSEWFFSEQTSRSARRRLSSRTDGPDGTSSLNLYNLGSFLWVASQLVANKLFRDAHVQIELTSYQSLQFSHKGVVFVDEALVLGDESSLRSQRDKLTSVSSSSIRCCSE